MKIYKGTSVDWRGRSAKYRAYQAARSRCTNPNVRNYNRYGGRGILFKFASFDEFFDHIGPRPSASHSLDRRNNNGHYEKGNVWWATSSEQAYNREKHFRIKPRSDLVAHTPGNPLFVRGKVSSIYYD